MLDESKPGQLSLGPGKRKRKRLYDPHKLKDAASGGIGSSNADSLSEPKSESLPTGSQKKSKEAIAPGNAPVVEGEASTEATNIHKDWQAFGTDNQDSTLALLKQVFNVVLDAYGKHELENMKYALATIRGIGPKDELERLLAVQMIGVHSLAVEFLSRASQENQTTVGVDANVNRATKLLRTFTAQMEALNRHRGKIGQQLVVGNVNVNEGGQAIVGAVSHDGHGKVSPENDADKVE